MIKLKPKLLIILYCFVCVIALGMTGSEVFAASACPDVNGNCEIEGNVNVTDLDPNDSNVLNVYKMNGETVLRRFLISNGSQKKLLALGINAGINFDTDYSDCDGLTGDDLTQCQIDNRSPNNIFIGYNAADSAVSSVNTVILGDDAAESAEKIGTLNTIIGTYANSVATSIGAYNTVVGATAGQNNAGFNNTFIGTEAGRYVTTGWSNVLIGVNAGAGHYRGNGLNPIRAGYNNIHIGHQTESITDTISHTIVLGHMTEVENDHQMVVGSDINFACYYDSGGDFVCGGQKEPCDDPNDPFVYESCTTAYISESYWGSGIRAEKPEDFSFHATGGKGEDIAGANLIIAGGKSTGNADGGSIRFQTSPKGTSSGANQNGLEDRLVIESNGTVKINTNSEANNYESFTITHDGDSGGGFFSQREGNDPFVNVSGWDHGSGAREVYIGGGGWLVDDANQISFWTDPTYGGNNDEGQLRMFIAPNGNVSISNQGTLEMNPEAVLEVIASGGEDAFMLSSSRNSDGDLFIVDGSGNVGIGTTTPQAALDVNGSIYQRGSQLHADYVFNPDYKLESIDEHSQFMWDNKHLSAVPKARIDKKGQEFLNVGAHRKGMLEELEKAHIYIEQLHNRLKMLEEKLAKLEKN